MRQASLCTLFIFLSVANAARVKNSSHRKALAKTDRTLSETEMHGNTTMADDNAIVVDVNSSSDAQVKFYDMDKLRKKKYVNGKGEQVDGSSRLQNYVGLYFSAWYCKPCSTFRDNLASAYEELHDALEIIWVSSDSNKEHYKSQLKDLPWLAIPIDDNFRNELASEFKIKSIPVLVLLDSNGKVITRDGVQHVLADPLGFSFPWED
eukprot:gnl/MRDRNA2_/MRDRNA2_68102_c0_seq1.p1 gnl/MRDRNA2_/MRDRNA2_68102_c0~~gnl/MRDRNA2_/MRDRNA2_68102_c0_seq1.p1  ORF type:complete len:207 (+),score=34.95 gnl/MRDRNA2_/MRDRNA2_68102_c0_seq1:94-714(+)